MKSQGKDLIYLYCVTDEVPQLEELKEFVDSIYFVFHIGLYAVVSKVSPDEFGEENLRKNFANLDWVKTKVSIHEKIIEGVMKDIGVVPFKFATLFNTEDTLKEMLEKQARILKKNLDNLRGKEEWGVKIYCDIGKLKENLSQKDKELVKLDKQIKSSSIGKAFILWKRKGEMVKTLINKKLNEYGKDSYERLKQHSIKSKVNKLLPREVTDRKDDMILNSAFLIEKNKVPDFTNTVEDIKVRYTAQGLYFDNTGPWPPYNFCSVGEKAQSG